MDNTPILLNAKDFWKAAKDLLLFEAMRYSAGPSKSHLKGSHLVFLDGLMTRANKKADVVKVTQGLNAAALLGWAVLSNKTKINQLLTMVFKLITNESDSVCELAASLSAIELEWPEYSEISSHPQIVHALASLEFTLYSKLYKQLEAARKL